MSRGEGGREAARPLMRVEHEGLRPVNPRWTVSIYSKWYGWYPRRTRRDGAFWWQVGAQVKVRKLRLRDRAAVLKVCEEVDRVVEGSFDGR